MKLASPKTLLAALLGCIFVVLKVMTFDGFLDFFWIICIGYLSIKGLFTAFSQEAYDEDVKQAQQVKILYQDLFGKFAYIVTDIPILLIFLAGLLALVCPATVSLRIVLIGLLFIEVVYAIWLFWYVLKNKRLRKERGEWGTAVLCAEDEKSWKRSERWHNICLGIIAVPVAMYLIFGHPRIYMNNAKLENALTKITDDRVTLEDIVPFEWTTVYTFAPYTSIKQIKRITGSNSPALKESVNEGMTHVVFTNKGTVVASVCAYPASLGYSLSFIGDENTYYDYSDDGYSYIEYGDKIIFEVTRENGLVNLSAYIDK